MGVRKTQRDYNVVPSVIFKGCFDTLLAIDMSLSSGVMLDSLGVAELHPTLKKSNADYFRSISNPHLVSKVVEKAVADQLTQHLQKHDPHETFPPAYKTCHSTVTSFYKSAK